MMKLKAETSSAETQQGPRKKGLKKDTPRLYLMLRRFAFVFDAPTCCRAPFLICPSPELFGVRYRGSLVLPEWTDMLYPMHTPIGGTASTRKIHLPRHFCIDAVLCQFPPTLLFASLMIRSLMTSVVFNHQRSV
jgi:hypothetical protein